MTPALTSLIRQHVVDPAGWMLLHSVWQIAILTALAATGMRVFRDRSPELRYGLLSLTLVVIVAVPLTTFWLASPTQEAILVDHDAGRLPSLDGDRADPLATPPTASPIIVRSADDVGSPSTASRRSSVDSLVRPTLQSIFPWLVGCWMAGVLLLSVWNLGGWIAVQRLLKLGIRPVDDAVRAAVKRLSVQLGLRRQVQVLQSAVVAVPSVIGWLRPKILMPAAVLTGLSTKQIEAILAHEIAHIHRADYVVNLIQTVVETLLFYHPGVWYISTRMREEREYAADRIASELIGDSTVYASALARLEEDTAAQQNLVLAATGGSLLRRIRLILGMPTTDPGRTSSWLVGAVASTVAVAVLMTAPVLHAKISESSAPRVAMQRIWADESTEISGRVSRGGKRIAYIQWDDGNLAVHDLPTGDNRLITTEGTWESPNRWAESPIWSADGTRILYAWFMDDAPNQLRIISLEGTDPQILFAAAPETFVYPVDWGSANDEVVLAYQADTDGGGTLLLIDVKSGTPRRLANFPRLSNVTTAAISPDGNLIAFTRRARSRDGDIYLYDIAQSRVTPIVQHPAHDHSPVWSPDGRWLTFVSTRSGITAVWMIRVSDEGRPEPDDVRRFSATVTGGRPMGFTDGGEYFIGRGVRDSDIIVTDYDPDNQRAHGRPRRLVRLFEGRNSMPAWSPNGRDLAYLSMRPTSRGVDRLLVVIRNEQTGNELVMDAGIVRLPLTRTGWLPDGSALLVFGTHINSEGIQQPSLVRCDATTGDVSVLARWDQSVNQPRPVSIAFAVAPDGSSIYFASPVNGEMHLVQRRFDVEVHNESIVTALPQLAMPDSLSVSPDGRYLAAADASLILLVDLQTRQIRRLFEAGGGEGTIRRGLSWTAGSDSLIFGQDSEMVDSRSSFWRVSLTGAPPEKIGIEMSSLDYPQIHPLGRQLVFEGRRHRYLAEVWSIRHSLISDSFKD